MNCPLCRNGRWKTKEHETINDKHQLVKHKITTCSNPDCGYRHEKQIHNDYEIICEIYDNDYESVIEREVLDKAVIIHSSVSSSSS